MITRREFNSAIVGAGTAAASAQILAASTSDAIGTARGPRIPFGSAFPPGRLGDAAFEHAIVQNCQQIVPEWGLKWRQLRPAQAQSAACSTTDYKFGPFDELHTFAEKNGLEVRGHPLIWGDPFKLPKWANEIRTEKEAKQQIEWHIRCVMGRYPGIKSWDVVNEPIGKVDKKGNWDPKFSKDGLRPSVWLEKIGPSYIHHAFQVARSVNPNVQLVLNDFNIEISSKKRGRLLEVVKQLHSDELIDAVGLQCHITGGLKIHDKELRAFVQELDQRGLKVLITELDVKDHRLPADIDKRDHDVAESVRSLLKAVAVPGAVSALLTWGITDRYTWLSTSVQRHDKLPLRPLPLDCNYQPKEMMKVIQEFCRGDLQ